MQACHLYLSFGCALVAILAPAQEEALPEYRVLRHQFDSEVRLKVQQSYDEGVTDLNAKYDAALDRALETAQRSGRIEDVVAIKNEKAAIGLHKTVPENDKSVPALVQLRETYHAAMNRLEAERLLKYQPLRTAFAAQLDLLIGRLTKEGRFDDAVFVRKRLGELNGANSEPIRATVNSVQPASTDTKSAAFVNSLGMKFVPVPGTKVLMCIHETRRQDYAQYAAESSEASALWKAQQKDGLPCGNKDDHAVVGVSWDDARRFCDWLTKKEGNVYRLPADREWSIAVGLKEKNGAPKVLAAKEQTQFPWGDTYPPKTQDLAGNYADDTYHEMFPKEPCVNGYKDGFITTAPVMSFRPNRVGLYDMGGNAWEWVEDQWSPDDADRVLRGGSFKHSVREELLSSYRYHLRPSHAGYLNGFRCVVVPAN